ncbi:hypothetical protein SOVF_066520 [Spinacia oleracea]|nr:hypothetical protein SOVF_066520 [Spinacia oleracea]
MLATSTYADRVICYENSGGEQVEVTVPIASPLHRRSYDVVPEHYVAAPRVRVRRWMLLIDSLKRHCAKMTQKLSGRDREGKCPLCICRSYQAFFWGCEQFEAFCTSSRLLLRRKRLSALGCRCLDLLAGDAEDASGPDVWGTVPVHGDAAALSVPFPSAGSISFSQYSSYFEVGAWYPWAELDRDLERYRSRHRGKEPAVDITAGDDSD